MSKVFVIMGMTGAGKSVVSRHVCHNLKMERLKTTTTRPRRSEHDNEYHFANVEDFLQDDGRYIAIRAYTTLIEDLPKKHYYAVDKLELEKGGILITDFDGFKELCERGTDVVGIYLHADKDIRYRRAIKREGFKADEFWRRDADDKEKFAIQRIVDLGRNYPLYIVNNSETVSLLGVIEKVQNIIKEHRLP